MDTATTTRTTFAVAWNRLADFASEFDRWLDEALALRGAPATRLVEAMRYSSLGPGKRVRPYLVVRCCDLAGGAARRGPRSVESSTARGADSGLTRWALTARPAALAVECVHAFSLIHDDLPAMDDDDLRRGRPTCHRQFDEATAILAGDALLSEAFALLAQSALPAPTIVALVGDLAAATGPAGMIGGQSLDMLGESLAPDEALVRRIHALKTARLFEASARMGARCAEANPDTAEALGQFGQMFGLLFQATDDLLDVLSSADDVGKRTGKDAESRKQTLPASIGVERSRGEVDRLAREAAACLADFGDEAEDLRELVEAIAHRRK